MQTGLKFRGADGVERTVSADNPLPTTASASPLPTGAATEATLATRASEATVAAMSAKLPSAVGSRSPDGSLSTVPANAASASVAAVNSTTSSVALLASSSARMGAVILNNSTATLYIRFGQAVSIGGHTLRLLPQESLILGPADFRGSIFGIWDAVNGQALVTTITA